MANPKSVRELLVALRPLGFTVSLHLHDTVGLGLANVYAGLLEGVSIFETSVGGLGGCPFTPGAAGNVATEDVVYLCEQMGIETSVDLRLLCEAAKLAEFIIGAPLPGRVYRSK
jgi:hydroxymethylglutaryl-CoA lyase